MASAAKVAVEETVMTTNAFPVNQEATGYISPAPTANVSSILIGANGVISINYTPAAGDGTILLVPTLQANGELTWTCNEGTLRLQYRPSTCRVVDY